MDYNNMTIDIQYDSALFSVYLLIIKGTQKRVVIIKFAFDYRSPKRATLQTMMKHYFTKKNMALNPKPLIMNVFHVWFENNKYQCITITLRLVRFSSR